MKAKGLGAQLQGYSTCLASEAQVPSPVPELRGGNVEENAVLCTDVSYASQIQGFHRREDAEGETGGQALLWWQDLTLSVPRLPVTTGQERFTVALELASGRCGNRVRFSCPGPQAAVAESV